MRIDRRDHLYNVRVGGSGLGRRLEGSGIGELMNWGEGLWIMDEGVGSRDWGLGIGD